jgi:hypothetical protein
MKSIPIKVLPPDDSAVCSAIDELEQLLAGLKGFKEVANLLSMLGEEGGDLFVTENKIVPTADACNFTVLLKPSPLFLDVLAALRVAAWDVKRDIVNAA